MLFGKVEIELIRWETSLVIVRGEALIVRGEAVIARVQVRRSLRGLTGEHSIDPPVASGSPSF